MFKPGQLLLAEPYLLDPNFKRAAVLLVDCHEEGTVGFVLNRPLEYQVAELIHDFPSHPNPVFAGGPVQNDTLHFVHMLGDYIPNSIKISEQLYWGGDLDALKDAIEADIASSNNLRFFLGYSGWSPGQLDEEMAEKTWIISESTPELIFSTHHERIWSKAMELRSTTHGVIGTLDEESLN